MSEVKTLKVGSRKSELALIQTNHVISELQKLHPDHKVLYVREVLVTAVLYIN